MFGLKLHIYELLPTTVKSNAVPRCTLHCHAVLVKVIKSVCTLNKQANKKKVLISCISKKVERKMMLSKWFGIVRPILLYVCSSRI